MNEQELIFQQYKLYSEQKESFIERSFKINRFYLCLSVILLIVTQLAKGFVFIFNLPLCVFMAIIGMCVTVLWWMNMDAYNMLIKIKFSNVIEEMEKQLPVQPYSDEYKGIKEYRENKKMFLFSDIQKTFAFIIFIMFFVSLIENIVPAIIK